MNRIVLFSSDKRYRRISGYLKRYYPDIVIHVSLRRNLKDLFSLLYKDYKSEIIIDAGILDDPVIRMCRYRGISCFRGLKDYFIYRQNVSVEEFERSWVAFNHIENMDEYFSRAEPPQYMSRFWSNKYPFYRMFSKLDQTKIIELACGRGRHVQKYIDSAKDITLVDVLEKNIDICKRRYRGSKKIHYYINNGKDLSELPDSSYSSLFTYDAMVHFHYLDVNNYLKETFRVLKPGSYALFHHSNNDRDYKMVYGYGYFSKGRAFMSKNLFAHMAYEAGFEIVEQKVLNWEGVRKLDCVTLLRKRSIDD